MANFKLAFLDEDCESQLQVFCNTEDRIYISINEEYIGHVPNAGFITFDVDTAIKFSKELRRQIAIAKERILFNSDKDGE